MKKVLVALLLSIVAVFSVSAHTLWLESNRYYVESGAKAYMFFGWGHRLPLDDPVAAEKIKFVKLHEPDGEITPIAISEGRNLHYTPIEYSKKGTYILSGESNPGYYTMYLDKNRKMHHFVGPMDEVTDAEKIVFSVLAHQYPKSIITSGSSSGGELKPVGGKLEIVPKIEPARLGAGNRFSFSLYLDGEVMKNGKATYSATYMGYSLEPEAFLYSEREFVNGHGDFDISCPGIWFVEATYETPPPESFKNKCKAFYYHASLTFAVREKVAEENAPLAKWNGKWHNAYLLLEDPAMQKVYDAIAEAAPNHTADDVKKFFSAMQRSDFGDVSIKNNAIAYYNADGTPKARCMYESAGKETVSFGPQEFDWYKFELKSGHGDCDGYKYVIATLVHADTEDSFSHFHTRYGDSSFDDLINNKAFAMWFPTFIAGDTTAQKMADGMLEAAAEMAAMLSAMP